MQMACVYSCCQCKVFGVTSRDFAPATVTDLTLDLTLCVVCKSRPGER